MSLLRELVTLTEAIGSADLAKAYEGSYFTILGAGGNLQDWVDGVNKELESKKIGTPKKWVKTTGAAINKFAATKGNVNNPFADDLTVLMFDLKGLDTGKLAMFKLQFGARWFDDVVDNMVDTVEEGKKLNKSFKNRTFASFRESYEPIHEGAKRFDDVMHDVENHLRQATTALNGPIVAQTIKDTKENYDIDGKPQFRNAVLALDDAQRAVAKFYDHMAKAK